MDQAAVWLAGSILAVLGFLVVLGGILIANNLVAKYWKSWGWKLMPSYWDQPSPQFMSVDEENKIAPILNEDKKDKTK